MIDTQNQPQPNRDVLYLFGGLMLAQAGPFPHPFPNNRTKKGEKWLTEKK
jgi:hypothetical protein